jgi:F0F1-type ATP synthase membrane subunit b/b'
MTTPVDDGDIADERIDRPPVDGALRELIKVEERIEVEVAEAETEAQRIVERARRNVRAVGQDERTSFEEALGVLRAEVEKECVVSERELVEGGAAEVERYRGVDEAKLRRLAQWVASRVAGGSEAS